MLCAKTNRREITELIQNEQYHYIELQHRSEFIQKMWDIGKAIREHHYVSIDYQRTRIGQSSKGGFNRFRLCFLNTIFISQHL